MSKFGEYIQRSKEASQFNKAMENLRTPTRAKELKKSHDAISIFAMAFWIPALIAAMVFFVMGRFDSAGRSALVFALFIAISILSGSYHRRAIKKAQDDFESKKS